MVKEELSQKEMFDVPTLTCGQELWVPTEENEITDTSGREEFPPLG